MLVEDVRAAEVAECRDTSGRGFEDDEGRGVLLRPGIRVAAATQEDKDPPPYGPMPCDFRGMANPRHE